MLRSCARLFSHIHTDGLRRELTALHGISSSGMLFRNLNYTDLSVQEHAYQETQLVFNRRVNVIHTGEFTGRSPKDKYFVYHEGSESGKNIDWNKINQKISPVTYHRLEAEVKDYLSKSDRLYIYDGYLGHSGPHENSFRRKKVRVLTKYAWQHHFLKNMVIPAQPGDHSPIDFTIYNASDLRNKGWKEDGMNSDVFAVFNVEGKSAIIGGTHYAGEMKKGFFTMMNYWMPLQGILPMHCSANISTSGETTLFFGLSGTGKTTHSALEDRALIGDDEHCWDGDGIFNIEGGCYAKTAKLSAKDEPVIYSCIRDDALLENVKLERGTDGDLYPNYHDLSLTENGRVSYPISYVKGYQKSGRGNHPKRIVFLTCDAYGILPPVSLLSEQQAYEYFLLGYTAKVAGTERGVKEPQATFSSCFGAAFLPLAPTTYANLLMKKVKEHGSQVYLVNTGWSGGPVGVGNRIDMSVTRQVVRSIIDGDINEAPTTNMGYGFNLKIPTQLRAIDPTYLSPWKRWGNYENYTTQANNLSYTFRKELEGKFRPSPSHAGV